MATTRLSDLQEPEVFTAAVRERTTRLDSLVQSGIITTSPMFDARANGAGDITDMPYWNDLTTGLANVATDDPAVKSTPNNITQGKMVVFRNHRNQSWGAMDIEAAVIGEDPLGVIADLVAKYWVGERQKMLIAMLQGIAADNKANDGGDMVHSIATDDAGAVTDDESITPNAILDLKQTAGDAGGQFTTIALNSTLYTNLQKRNLIAFTPDSVQQVNIPTYLGYRVIVDDGIPTVEGTNRVTETAYLFGNGLFGLGVGTPKNATEVWRDPAAGRGSGEEVLFNRQQFILHPKGFSVSAASASGKSPTNAEYAVAGAWDRVLERKKIPLAILEVNA